MKGYCACRLACSGYINRGIGKLLCLLFACKHYAGSSIPNGRAVKKCKGIGHHPGFEHHVNCHLVSELRIRVVLCIGMVLHRYQCKLLARRTEIIHMAPCDESVKPREGHSKKGLPLLISSCDKRLGDFFSRDIGHLLSTSDNHHVMHS